MRAAGMGTNAAAAKQGGGAQMRRMMECPGRDDDFGDQKASGNISNVQWHEGCVAAVVENRAREVGLACLDPHTLTLSLTQFIEPGWGYTHTLLLLQLYDPSSLFVIGQAEGSRSSGRASLGGIVNATSAYKQQPVGRTLFDDTKGQLLLERFGTSCSLGKLLGSGLDLDPDRAIEFGAGEGGRGLGSGRGDSAGAYLAFGAAGALLQYLSSNTSLVLMPGSLHIERVGTGRHMRMDVTSVQALEV